MKIFDLFSLGMRNLKGKWVVLPVLGIAISVFSLCFAGAVRVTLQKEKSLPYVLEVSAGGSKKLTDSTVAQISKLPEVIAATPVLKVPVKIKTGTYSANIVLTGVKASYINDKFKAGTIFPDSSVMPYIVLNKAACKQFSEEKKITGINFNTDEAKSSNGIGNNTGVSKNDVTNNNKENDEEDEKSLPRIDWLKAGYTIQAGEGENLITSKICGVLEGEEKEETPAAYISIASAKVLLQKGGQSTDYTGINVRIRNIGYADAVSKAIKDLGVPVTNSNAQLQDKWDDESKEMVYLMVIGVFSLACSVVLMLAWRKISLLEQKEAWKILRWIGMKEKDIARLFVIQALIISLLGIAVGIIVSLALPSFLQRDIKEVSIYRLQIPLFIAALSGVICITAALLPMMKIEKSI